MRMLQGKQFIESNPVDIKVQYVLVVVENSVLVLAFVVLVYARSYGSCASF